MRRTCSSKCAGGGHGIVDIEDWREFTFLNRPFWITGVPGLGITLGRILNLGALPTYYVGRVFAFGLFALLAYLAVRTTPVGKTYFAMVFLLPSVLSLGVSYSWDGTIIALAMLFVALCLRAMVEGRTERLSPRFLAALAIVGVALAPCKLFYSLLVLLVIPIPSTAFASARQSKVVKASMIVGVLGVGILFNVVDIAGVAAGTQMVGSAGHYILFDNKVSFSDVFANPLHYMRMFVDTVLVMASSYVSEILGAVLSWRNVTGTLSVFLTYVYLALLILAVMLRDGSRWRAPISMRLIIVVVVAGILVGVMGAQLVGWNTLDQTLIEGVQGRYFLPLLGLVVPLTHGFRASIGQSLAKPVLMVYLAFAAINLIDLAATVYGGM